MSLSHAVVRMEKDQAQVVKLDAGNELSRCDRAFVGYIRQPRGGTGSEVKRGEGKGYAGIVNPLFSADNRNMVYGDAQAVMAGMIEAVRGLGLSAAA